MSNTESPLGPAVSGRLHPRPLLTRDAWLDLDGDWGFRADDEDAGLDAGWWRFSAVHDVRFDRTIRVPYPPESELSGIGEDGHAVVWYRRAAAISAPPAGHRVILHLGAVDHHADVWVNGVHVGAHDGGHVGFALDITHALVPGDTQLLVVRAVDDPHALDQPRGKQDWEPSPHVIWYRRTTGIWRQVWAETVAARHLDALRWTPGARPGEVTLDVTVTGARSRDDLELETVFTLDGTVLARARHAVTDETLHLPFVLRDARLDTEPDRLLWSPDRPTLIDVELTLWHGEQEIDRARSSVGLRTVAVEDGRFMLNGHPAPLRLVLEQAFWPQSHLAAPDDDALRREVELVKALGFTGIRMHQTVADPRFLHWCDRLGLLVWADAPAAYRFSPRALERTTHEWLQAVARDAGHPSIIAWVAFNESWGVPDVAVDVAQQHAVRGITGLLKALDPSRPVIGNDGWEWVAGDVVGVHDYTHDGAVLRARYGSRDAVTDTVAHARPGGRRLVLDPTAAEGLPVVLSEFGGIGFHTSAGDWEGYGAVTDEEAFLARLRELVGAVHDSTGLAGFCWTQLTDTLQETNGLLDEHRRPKADIGLIRAIIAGEDR
ncbi:glycoside hydrolase family 2 [Tersicoccus sp. Bi-70]|uniref:glycoside hydrolase family 2 n=1 Tax=Tersicoccus sp. Bi-70 TaxID=1897634 RepID=UPI000976841C|nr:glycoside hydrolase family 2 [Tersicoccus sp. Bi-70]OMH36950.1 hypothetical protein BGP79_14605 [Tersicoccus sp. Bi-70]